MPVSPRRPLGGLGRQVVFTLEDHHAVVAGETSLARILDLSDLRDGKGDDFRFQQLIGWGEAIAGQGVRGTGIIRFTSEEWLRRWRSLRREDPQKTALDLSRERLRELHLRRADQLEGEENLEGARWHLERAAELGEKVDTSRLLGFEEFVRAWPIPEETRPWEDHGAFVFKSETRDEVKAIEELALRARLSRSAGSFVDFILLSPRRTEDVVAYALRTIDCDAPRNIRILAGNDDALRIWVNARPVLERLVLRGAMADQESCTANLASGVNRVLVEVSNAGGGWGFYFRLEDESGRKLRLTGEGKLEPLDAPR
jgi:hypothetical protein